VRLALLLLALLSACASAPIVPTAAGPGWSGKLGYRVDATAAQRAQAGSALFELQGDAREGSLLLQTPLGASLAEARWGPQGLSLSDGQQEQRFASLDQLGAALGERLQAAPLPLAALFDWLQGRPWTGAPHTQGADGLLQLGWQVQRDGQRLRLSRAAEGASGAITLTLILNPA
jgi:outer membrane lipoprotein LolB